MSSRIVVRPVRFTDNVKPMQAFLELLGLRPRVESQEGSWVDMVCAAGMVALHSAATSDTGGKPGQTRLSFEADDVDVLAKDLTSAGVADVAVYDEAYGRVLTCTDPMGDKITVDERGSDLYGYRLHPLHVDLTTRVLPVRFTNPQGPYAIFLTSLGLAPVGEPNDVYAKFGASDGTHGLVGLHYVYSEELPIVAGPGAVHLTFETDEPLPDVADRLGDRGIEVATTQEDFGAFLTMTDPDGQQVQMHETPPMPA